MEKIAALSLAFPVDRPVLLSAVKPNFEGRCAGCRRPLVTQEGAVGSSIQQGFQRAQRWLRLVAARHRGGHSMTSDDGCERSAVPRGRATSLAAATDESSR